MSSQSSRDPADRLVDADSGISEAHLREFRMGLEKSVESLERTARDSQRVAIRFFIAIVVCTAFAFLLNALQPLRSPAWNFIGGFWSVSTFLVQVGFVITLIRYWTVHRPTLERARTDLQIAMFGELQREIAALRGDLERERGGAPA